MLPLDESEFTLMFFVLLLHVAISGSAQMESYADGYIATLVDEIQHSAFTCTMYGEVLQ